jgi:hypothetical protein
MAGTENSPHWIRMVEVGCCEKGNELPGSRKEEPGNFCKLSIVLDTFVSGPVDTDYILKSIQGKFQSNTISSSEGVRRGTSVCLKAAHKKLPQELYISIPANIFPSPHP